MEFGDGSPAMSPEGVDGESPFFGSPATSPASRQLPYMILSLFSNDLSVTENIFSKVN